MSDKQLKGAVISFETTNDGKLVKTEIGIVDSFEVRMDMGGLNEYKSFSSIPELRFKGSGTMIFPTSHRWLFRLASKQLWRDIVNACGKIFRRKEGDD